MVSDLTEAGDSGKSLVIHRALLALILPLALAAGGCFQSNGNAASALSLDPLTTNAIAPLSAESEIMSDEKVVRDLVGGLETGELIGDHPWSNALTGSAGVVSDLATLEYRAINQMHSACLRCGDPVVKRSQCDARHRARAYQRRAPGADKSFGTGGFAPIPALCRSTVSTETPFATKLDLDAHPPRQNASDLSPDTLTDGSRTCRLFQTTRHGFDGVALFDGRACKRPDGGWDLVSFDRVGG